MRQPTYQTREGFAILAAIIGVLVMSTLTMTALKIGMQETRSARATLVSASALYVADAGVNIFRSAWPEDAISPGQIKPYGETELPNGSKYYPVVHRRDSGLDKMQIYSLTVEGQSPGPLGGKATVQIWATRFKLTARFTGAINAKGNVSINGSPSLVDSYDSELGDYCNAAMMATDPPQCTTLNVGSEGDVRANGTVSLSGDGSRIYGDVTAGDTVKDVHSGITGTETEYAPKELYPVETCPGYTASMPGSVYTPPNVSITGSYTIQSGTYSFHDFKMSGNGVLVIPDGANVKIYLSGVLSMTGQSFVNNEGRSAAALSFVACNGGTVNKAAWLVAGGTTAFFTIYAPNNDVTLAGGSPLFGAVVGNNFKATGGAAVHYDVALGRTGDESEDEFSKIMPRSWRQLLH